MSIALAVSSRPVVTPTFREYRAVAPSRIPSWRLQDTPPNDDEQATDPIPSDEELPEEGEEQ